MLRTNAVLASKACISRKSSFSASGTFTLVQVSPPSTVRRTDPLAPLAQAIWLETALMPRSCTSAPLVWCRHCPQHADIPKKTKLKIAASLRILMFSKRIKIVTFHAQISLFTCMEGNQVSTLPAALTAQSELKDEEVVSRVLAGE